MPDITPRSAPRQIERSVKLECKATPEFDTRCSLMLGLQYNSGRAVTSAHSPTHVLSPNEATSGRVYVLCNAALRLVSWAASGIVTAHG